MCGNAYEVWYTTTYSLLFLTDGLFESVTLCSTRLLFMPWIYMYIFIVRLFIVHVHMLWHFDRLSQVLRWVFSNLIVDLYISCSVVP